MGIGSLQWAAAIDLQLNREKLKNYFPCGGQGTHSEKMGEARNSVSKETEPL